MLVNGKQWIGLCACAIFMTLIAPGLSVPRRITTEAERQAHLDYRVKLEKLWWAAADGDADAVRKAVEAGADLNGFYVSSDLVFLFRRPKHPLLTPIFPRAAQ